MFDDYDFDIDQWLNDLAEETQSSQLHRLNEKIMTTDNRRTPSYHHIEYFKARAKAYLSNKTANGRKSAAEAMDNYLKTFKNLEQYDPRGTTVAPMSKTNDNNYIEIKQGGITFRKAGNQLTIICNQTIDYTESNVNQIIKTLEGGLEIIAAASKFDLVNSTPPKGVSI